MKHLKTSWLVLFGLVAAPYVLLVAAGSVWLYERGLLLWWIAVSVGLTLASWPVMRWLRARSAARRRAAASPPSADRLFGDVSPDPGWPPRARQAWDEVEAIARRVQHEDLPLDRPDAIWKVVYEVMDAVARQYHPKVDEPAWEMPVPEMLGTVERVARDLRKVFSENVPGAHILTIGDLGRIKRLADGIRQFSILYRLASVGLNPVSAAISAVRDTASDDLWSTSTEDLRQWAVGFCVRKAGWYAIELYSGRQVLDEAALRAFQSPQSRRDADRAQAAQEQLAEEPFRVLVLGQVKSGKSSLVNALFGEPRAAVDVVPRTSRVEPYLLEREGIPRAIILDTAGYDEGSKAADTFAGIEPQVLQSDLILVVVSALLASRAADRRLLDDLRASFRRQPDRLMPPVVVALTHVDELRPLAEWEPPYDLARPSGPKAQNILDALRTVEEALALTASEVVVPVCLKPERVYNVEDGLAPAIFHAIPEAQRVKYLRCLRQFREGGHWQRLWQQALSAGRVLLTAGADWAGRKLGR